MPVTTAVEESTKSVPSYSETICLCEAHEEAQKPEFSRHARNVIAATLASGFVLLAVLSAWLWYGAHLYQNCDASALGIKAIGL